jgi:DNA replication and repair protein RecF
VHLTRLALTDFRCYASAEVGLRPGVMTFTGPNGEGKTNLVEAAGYVSTLASHRVAADGPLIRHGASRAIIRAAVASAGRQTLVEIEVNPGAANRARVNRAPVRRAREVLGILRCVLFAPEDIALVKGDPEQRRRYLDDLLVATRPRYASLRADYERTVRQRTALLKSARARGGVTGRRDAAGRAGGTGWARDADRSEGGAAPSALQVWDEQLISAGAELTAARVELVRTIRPLLAKAYSAVSGGAGEVTARYRQSFRPAAEPEPDRAELAAALRQALADCRQAELDRALCLAGPHRDELELGIGDLPARGYASHGESWSLALGLRLASYELLRSDGADPVLLLDDVFAELDSGRRSRLAELVGGAEQVLVTAAVPDDVPASLVGDRFAISGGTISRA